MSNSCPTQLKDHYQSGRLIPFIGAGASMAVEWETDGKKRRGPSWTELVNEAARKLGFDNPDLLRVRGTDLQILEYFGAKSHGYFAGLTNWLYAEMNPSDDALRASIIHERLSKLELC